MNLTIITPARDAMHVMEDYLAQYRALDWDPEHLRLVICEGDSVDGTKERLAQAAEEMPSLTVVTRDTGMPRYGSVVDSGRFVVLSTVFNAAIDAVDLAWSDYVMMLPVDIRYQPDLPKRLQALDKDLVAPFVYTDDARDIFYDTWGFTRYGKPFWNFPRAFNPFAAKGPIEMGTVGCVVLIRSQVLRDGVRYTRERVDRGLCEKAREKGYGIWADPGTEVFHRDRPRA